MLGVWLAPACASICSNMTPEAGSRHCQGDAGMSHKAAPKSDDCQARPCDRLQAVQTDTQTAPASLSSHVFNALGRTDRASLPGSASHRPWCAMSLGPPVPAPLFTILRA